MRTDPRPRPLAEALVSDEPWKLDSACSEPDHDLFFAQTTTSARAICATCPVIEPCLDYALANNIDHGVWGGTSARERKNIKRAKRRRTVT